ncbi:MAG: hypothetical protein U0003_04595 [Vampirovibrionales bacterium]
MRISMAPRFSGVISMNLTEFAKLSEGRDEFGQILQDSSVNESYDTHKDVDNDTYTITTNPKGGDASSETQLDNDLKALFDKLGMIYSYTTKLASNEATTL